MAKNVVKKYRKLSGKKPYGRPPPRDAVDTVNNEISDNEDTINDLDVIANLQPGRNAQIAAKKISEKYKKIRSKKIERAESLKIVELSSDDDEIVGAVSNISAQPAAKKIRQKYKDIRRQKAFQLLKLKGKENVSANETVQFLPKMLVWRPKK